MEVVILEDIQATYLTTWVRIANTSGHDVIKPGDEFKENGALEEFKIEATSFSPVPGASRIRLLRAHHSTKAEVHRAGAVLAQTNVVTTLVYGDHGATSVTFTNGEDNGTTGLAEPQPEIPDTIIAGGTEYANPAKRGRGRPAGSKNKPKQPLVPVWPGV